MKTATGKLTWFLIASAIVGGAYLTYRRPDWTNVGFLVVAVLLALKTWASRPRALPPDDSASILKQAHDHVRAGEIDQAVAILREDYEGKKRTLGDSHPVTLVAAQQLGTILVGVGRREQAIALMSALEPTLLREHDRDPDTWAVVMQSAANLWLDAESTPRAQEMTALGLRYASRMQGPARRRLELGLLGCQARAEVQRGNARAGLEATEALLAEAKTTYGVDDPLTQQLAICVMYATMRSELEATSNHPPG